MNITFRKIIKDDIPTIFRWLSEPFIQEFWDNTQGHRDDIINFTEGRKTPSTYVDGKYVYWIAQDRGHPFALIMTIQETSDDDINEVKLANLSKTGTSYGIDYMIGNKDYFGRGYGASTLSKFIDFFRLEVDQNADTFLIDPEANNPRAKHVYIKAGFEYIADFIMVGQVSGAGKSHHLLIKKFPPNANYLIHFNPLSADHLSLLHRWFQEPVIKKWYAREIHYSLDDIKNKYLPRIQGTDSTPSYIVSLNGAPVGFIQYYALSDHLPSGINDLSNKLFEINAPDEICGIDIFIADGKYRGIGLGKQIISQFIQEFLHSNFKGAVVDPLSNNINAIHCYEKSGFKITAYSEKSDYIILMKCI